MRLKRIILPLALFAAAFLFLGYIIGKHSSALSEEISGTYVSGMTTFSVDAEQGIFYYADSANKIYHTGQLEVLSNNLCKLEETGGIIPCQIVANSEGTLYMILGGTLCRMEKAFNTIVRLDTAE